jgi:hypothetical protein
MASCDRKTLTPHLATIGATPGGTIERVPPHLGKSISDATSDTYLIIDFAVTVADLKADGLRAASSGSGRNDSHSEFYGEFC